jgi:hypothetical protein
MHRGRIKFFPARGTSAMLLGKQQSNQLAPLRTPAGPDLCTIGLFPALEKLTVAFTVGFAPGFL